MSAVTYVNVFAYGSNLHIDRMRKRAASARPVNIGYVLGRKIEFHKRSVDGSAKADAMLTGRNSDRVWGAVYSVSSRDKSLLDRHEFLGIGYDETIVDVSISATKSIEALIYEARKEAIDHRLRPYSWYLDFVRHGALQHCLPYCYINRGLSVQPISDPNSSRETSNRMVLNNSGSTFHKQ